MNKLTLPIIGVLTGCSEYDINSIKTDSDTGMVETDTAADTAYTDTDSGTEDTAAPDINTDTTTETEEIPSTPFKTAIEACLQLDEAACQWNSAEGTQDTTCVTDAIAKKAALEAEILAKAQEVSGDSSLTMTDVENGAVETTVNAYYSLGQANLSSEPAWQEHAYINIAFGHVAGEFAAIDFPFESIPSATLRCMASSYSRDVDLPYTDAYWSNLETNNEWMQTDGTVPEDSFLNITDFSVYGTGSQVMEINGARYEQSDPNYNFTTTNYALEDSKAAIFSAAQTYTGLTGEGTRSVTIEY